MPNLKVTVRFPQVEREKLKLAFMRIGKLSRTPKTNAAQRLAVRRASGRCEICGARGKAGVTLNGAHIIPHEEHGGTQDDKILALCVRARSLASGKPSEIGCHDLLDRYQVWTRRSLLDLLAVDPRNRQTKITTLQEERLKWIRRIDDPLTIALANRRWSEALRILRRQLEITSPGKARVDMLSNVLVALRKSRRADKWPRIEGVVDTLLAEVHSAPPNLRPKVLYEFGMLCFQLRSFQDAAHIFERSIGNDDGSLINSTLAVLSRFEAQLRGKPSTSMLGQTAMDLEQLAAQIEQSFEERAEKRLNSFRIDAHVHAARAWAACGDADRAAKSLEQAIKIRESGIVEPSIFSNLMLAFGEVRYCQTSYSESAAFLARCGFHLSHSGHKDFEGLEHVIARLVSLPDDCLLSSQRRKLERGRANLFRYLDSLEPVANRLVPKLRAAATA